MINFSKSTMAFAVVALLSFGSNPAISAEDEDEASDVEEVVVTGSRIKRASNYDSTGPIEVFTAQQVIDSGKNNIGDFLLELPSANLASNQRSINNGNSGTTEFNLRGAGSERLLTLINGRRVAPSGTGTGSAVDMQIFPLSLIDSVEVLKDGASAVYGSDAVSGVLNIKLRQFEGFELNVMEGSSDMGDANSDLISIAFGTSGERSSMVATVSMNKNDSLDMWDRDFSFCPRLEPDYMLYFQWAGVPGHGNSGDKLGSQASCGASTFIPTGRFYTSSGSKTMFDGVGPNGTAESFSWAAYSGNGPGDPSNNKGMYNYSEWMQLLGGRENYQAWSAGTYELDSGIVLDFEIGASKRKSDLMMAPVPMGSGAQFTYGLTIPADNPFNPFGEDLAYRKRMLDVGPRLFSQEADTFRYVFGASGTLDRLGADWEAYHTRQEFSSTQLTENYINMLAVANAFDTELGAGVAVNGVQYRCKDAVARRLGCVPLNMFGPNSITAEAADYIRFNQLNRTGTIYQGYAANLSNITLFEMPAGAVLAAVGIDKSDLQGDEKVDALTASGGSSGNPRLSTSGSYDSTDYYAEFSAPLIADVTGFQELNLDYAYRHTSYSSFDSESVDRVAIKWKPMSDLTIRATSSTSYKAPTISNLYFGGGGGFPTYNDPCEANYLGTRSAAEQATAAVQCAADGLDTSTWATSNNQILSLTVGNPNLTPEEGENTTVGIVWEPTNIGFLEDIGFSVAVDSFELEIANAVTSSGSQGTLNRCYLQGIAADCAKVNRSYGGDVNSVQTSNINTSSADVYKGIDFSVNFTIEELSRIGGALEIDIVGTHYKENRTVDASGVSDDYVGKCYDFGESCFNRDRVNFSFRWYKDDWRVGLTTRYLSGIDYSPTAREYFEGSPYGTPLSAATLAEIEEIHSIDDITYSNLNIAYMATDHLNVSLSVSNLFDKEPPYFKGFQGFVDPQINTPQNTYDIVGRYFTLGFKLTY